MSSSPNQRGLGLDPASQLKANERVAHKQRSSTRRDKDLAQAFVERFIEAKEIRGFPIEDDDVADENRERGPQPSLKVAFEIEVGRAFGKNGTPVTAVSPSFFAFQLLSTTDTSYGMPLELLPREAILPDRLLAHVLRLPVKLDRRVAASIARRLYLLLMNRAGYVGPRTEASEPLPEPTIALPAIPAEPPPPPPRVADADPPPAATTEFCADCGSMYAGTHRCGEVAAAAPRPAPPARPRAPLPAAAPEPPAAKPVERRVIGYVKTRIAMPWYQSMGIGQEGLTLTMEAGTCLEVLDPDARDRQDQEWQVRHDKKQVIVIWWRDKRRLVFNDTVDRIDKADFDKYEKERADAEAIGAAGSGSAGEGAGAEAPG
jgi:hypothetical protein